ncbi:hypothetical protein ACBJ59_12145 [Nonomuraea sp. MTCD27]|uniref:hypothetical protein n=1 Tax=Nonomuraea sp. MTCD27 TaxID=1676747 RepID=UPI0035C249DB
MSSTEPLDDPIDEEPAVEEDEFGDWDDFWAERLRAEQAGRGGPATKTIRGVTVNIPADMPMQFEHKTEQVRRTGDLDGFKQLLADLFGVDVYDAWIAAGMGEREFQTVLVWGMANGRGEKTSFRQAYERVKAREQGKAETASTPASVESGDTGPSSKPTSAANTSSRRRRSAS